MDEPMTVFWLKPLNREADKIVDNEANQSRLRTNPSNVCERYLRVGLDDAAKVANRLVTFSRKQTHGDVILGPRYSNVDQCYFDFNPRTGELLLHDVSKLRDTDLYRVPDEYQRRNMAGSQLYGTPRQCVVQLQYEWEFQMGNALFRLIPKPMSTEGDSSAFVAACLDFVQKIPVECRTFENTLEELEAMDMQSETSTRRSYNIRRQPKDGRRQNERIASAKLGTLGSGGQGSVYKVVHLRTGDHYALKEVAWKELPQYGIHTESDFKQKLQKEIKLVNTADHRHIVPYEFHQGWEMGSTVEIFMPLYESSLQALLGHISPMGPEVVKSMTYRMCYQMLLALDHVHKQGIIHRDIKPDNILVSGDDFFLTDFGVAKFADNSGTMTGTRWYAAPEVPLGLNGPDGQTTKMDIYSLGATLVQCMGTVFSTITPDYVWLERWQEWHGKMQAELQVLAPRCAPMLAYTADQRPTASNLLEYFQVAPAATLQDRMTPPAMHLLPNNGDRAPLPAAVALPYQSDVSMRDASIISVAFEPLETPLTPGEEIHTTPRGDLQAVQEGAPLPQTPESPTPRPKKPAKKKARKAKSTKSAKSGSTVKTGRSASTAAGVTKRGTPNARELRSTRRSVGKAPELKDLGL